MKGGQRSQAVFGAIGRWALTYPKTCLCIWLTLFVLALPGALNVGSVLLGGNGGVNEAEAFDVEAIMKTAFDFPFAETYVVVVESAKFTVDDTEFETMIQTLDTHLLTEEDTLKTRHYYGLRDPIMRSADGHISYIVVGQRLAPIEVLEQRVNPIREGLQPVVQQLRQIDPQLKVMTTGINPIIADINEITSASTEKAEKQVFVITLGVLLLAFGSLTGALLPLLMALCTNMIALGIIYLLASYVLPISIFAQSISTMIGLAVGIDYALLFVWRFREEREKTGDIRQALLETTVKAGSAVFFAGFTFAIGLAGLFYTQITALYSIALGGILVVCLSILLSMTLLPALLLLVQNYLDFPRFLSARLRHFRPTNLWKPLALRVMARPVVYGGAALLIVGALSWPGQRLEIKEFDIQGLPERLESKQGFTRLAQMQVSGILVPLYILAEAEDGHTFLEPESLKKLQTLHQQLADHPRIERALSIAGIQGDAQTQQAYFSQLPMMQWLYPELFNSFLSQDKRIALVQLIPKDLKDFDNMVNYCRQIRATFRPQFQTQGLQIMTGGPPSITLDYNIASFAHIHEIVLGVIGATWLVLFLSLRSYLIALKAIVLNLLSVAISYGVVVLIFHDGWLPWIKTSSVMAYVPLLLFCLIFGMSIDYEVFLMTRIREEYLAGHSNEEATARGIAATGDVITYAALIMCIVFGAFTLVEVGIIRQLGFGLASAILADATLIRMILVPAFMKAAGRWNWIPGERRDPV